MTTLTSALVAALFVVSTMPAVAQQELPAAATIRGENIWLRVDPAEDTEVVAYLQRGDQVRITDDATAADGDAFYPVRVTETGETGWVRDLAIDPRSFLSVAAREEIVVDTPEDGRRLSEAEYLATMSEQSSAVTDSFIAMRDLMGAPDPENPEWQSQVSDFIAEWRRARRTAAAISPPPAYSETHAAYLRGLGHYNNAGTSILRLLETGDTTLVDEIVRELELGNNEITAATELLNQVA
jgi:hypothetical protein